MRFSIRFADKIVGTFVILAIAILIFVVFMIGSNQRWFARDLHCKTYLASAAGITRNMAVQYKGFTIGRIKNFDLVADTDRVEVIFTIFEDYTYLAVEGSLVEIQSSPLPVLGTGFIFHPGRGNEKIEEGAYIPEMSSPEAGIYYVTGMAQKPESGFDINNIINQVTEVLESINASLASSDGSNTPPIGKILNDVSRITGDIIPIIDNIRRITNEAVSPGGTVMTVLDGEGAFYSSLEDSIVSLSGIIDNLNKTSDFLPAQLPQLGVIVGDLNMVIKDIQDVVIAISNNPLLKGGIPSRTETGPGGASPRNLDF
ncbi:MAG: MlaD family protein [Treponema sp.]|nr:MlaD family protein [Treponema sp.]